MSASTVKCTSSNFYHRRMADNLENEDPDSNKDTESDELEETGVEGLNNIRPSYIGDEVSYRPPELTTDVIRNLALEFPNLVDTIVAEGGEEERIRTYLRIRPSSKHKKGEPFVSSLYDIDGDRVVKIKGNSITKKNNPYADETKFTFSRILGPDCSQSTVFEECVQPIVDSFFVGDSCLIFSYGATNSGKTFTMQGYGTQFGIVPRTLDHIFNFLEDKLYTTGNIKPNLFNGFQSLSDTETRILDDVKLKVLREVKQQKSVEMNSFRASFGLSSSASSMSSNSAILVDKILNIKSVPQTTTNHQYPSNVEHYAVWVSFSEIYNERVYDLFETIQKGKRRKDLKLLTDKEGRVYIKDLTELCANSAEEAYQLFLAGKNNLQFAVTQANHNSSRSHSFFNIRMVAVGMSDRGVAYPKKVFQMSFCDLAGIERVAQTGNVGVRLKESNNINQSLFVLLKCIRAMRLKQRKQTADILPFRESKLARLFQGFLTSATHTCMIVNLNPEPSMFDASLHVLQNSAIASEVVTYRRVEVPEKDSKFSRRVRDSIGYSNQIKESFNFTKSFNETFNEDDEDEEFAAATVVAKCKQPTETIGGKLARLEIENNMLKQDIETLEERVRREMLEQFAAIEGQYEMEQQAIAREREALDRHQQDRRISFAVKVWNVAKEDKQVGTSPMRFDNFCAPEMHRGHNASTPPNTSQLKSELKKQIQDALDLQNQLESYKAECNNLTTTLNERNSENARLHTEKMENEKLYQQQRADLEHLLQLKDEEIAKVKENDPSKMNDENLQHIKKLSEELKIANECKAGQEVELQDAVSVCVEYKTKLNEANDEITKMSTDFNKLFKEKQETAEECDLMHLRVDDLEEKLEAANKKIVHYERMISKSTKRF